MAEATLTDIFKAAREKRRNGSDDAEKAWLPEQVVNQVASAWNEVNEADGIKLKTIDVMKTTPSGEEQVAKLTLSFFPTNVKAHFGALLFNVIELECSRVHVTGYPVVVRYYDEAQANWVYHERSPRPFYEVDAVNMADVPTEANNIRDAHALKSVLVSLFNSDNMTRIAKILQTRISFYLKQLEEEAAA